MRTEKAMLDLIMETAQADERIRAVLLNGSRANPKAPRDIFQDFDITYFVTDILSFVLDQDWANRFGELMIIQLPELMSDPPPMADGHFAYLMQFMDGNRIDLSLFPVDMLDSFESECTTVVLLDKDHILPNFPPHGESSYLPQPPTAKGYADCCNEFWWVSSYVAKGLWRDEIPYAKYMLDQVSREPLMKMLTWHIGLKTGFTVNPGKLGKYFKRNLESDLWAMFEATYADAQLNNNWKALFVMCDLFRKIALGVGQHYGFEYPFEDDRKVSAHLRHVRQLPRDARQIY